MATPKLRLFLRPVGVLKISRGVEHVPKAETDSESSKNVHLKNQFSLGNVQTAKMFQKSPQNVNLDNFWFVRVVRAV